MNENQNIKQDLENILIKVAQARNIKNYEIILANKSSGNGMMADFFKGEILNGDNGRRTHVAIKKASMDGFSFERGHDPFYKNEILFYSEIFPKLDEFQKQIGVQQPFDQVPRYLTGYVDKENMYIAMENLKVEGYVLFNKNNYFDKNHLEFIFKIYGKFHALSFSYKRKHPEDYKNITRHEFGFPVLNSCKEYIPFFEMGYISAMESFNPITDADILAKLKTIENVKEVVEKVWYKGDYECEIHGDCWSNNMLFKYKESGELEDIKLLDFQLAYSSTPVFDLLYFFYTGASKEDFNKLDYYLDVYYQSFSNFARELGEDPEKLYPMDVLKKEWKEYGVVGFYLGSLLWLVKLVDTSEFVKLLGVKGLSREAYWERWHELNRGIAKGPAFREKMHDIIVHAVEYGIL